MDAFQCRLHFTNLLSRLTASAVAAKQAAQFALKNRDVDEDLFSVIVEQLQSKDCSMNVRVNILYFIETLCEQSLKADYRSYVKMIQHNLQLIVDAVAPNNPEGAANAETVKKVLQSLNRKGIVDRKTLKEMTEILAEREAAHKAVGESSDDTVSGGEEDEEGEPRKKRLLSDSIIQQRMEEDRERHKRLRENIWQIPAPQFEAEDPEFEKAWEEASDLNSDDFEIMREENEILASSVV
ncbi:CTD kinase subunit gamma CTK3-domain-containing protein [Sphaerosporella brunnea]|uniref:CTD kinase subunit gamma CTK3-domain-containing protein n=1 Tax=Sphaerosporella brunnea TaxID=1250544 RepID=A0A5J5EMR9_9PEZI|nr:CTD kinase subunit gamma CTK3-domain-containing protein [Sphaerosporella brunnea]